MWCVTFLLSVSRMLLLPHLVTFPVKSLSNEQASLRITMEPITSPNAGPSTLEKEKRKRRERGEKEERKRNGEKEEG